ncbi:uncharacterized protein LOC121567736 isoform X2 [Coregonus clupeaformis]|uniref:uncharacterized protein LOC121567736 isoform X2 n=1 Tax=Coregonus clupeaformis TaxID=59861 RepID=UPI001BE06D62|nr:uncharacterized protein LOC121567736 isoform X2 [Coregonus clupeaformis]
MGMTYIFLILTVFYVVVKSQLKPEVSMAPTFKLVYNGDTINLTCNHSTGKVKWLINDEVQEQDNKIWSIGPVSAKDSGNYQCENNGQKSDNFEISVLEYFPPATLSIKSGEPVINWEGAVVLELQVEESLMGWSCWVYKGGEVKKIKLKQTLTTDHTEIPFQTYRLRDTIAIYWCSGETDLRSTSITIKTSERMVLMEILPGPAFLGDELSLRCVVTGTDQISRAIFYKNDQQINDSALSFYHINNVTESDKGKYRCEATYRFKGSTSGKSNTGVSENQELIVAALPLKADLTVTTDMTCSCSNCPTDTSYRWYYKQHNQQWLPKGSGDSYTHAMSAGSYACRAVWKVGRSALSNIHRSDVDIQETNMLLIIIFVMIVLGVILVIGAIILYRKRTGEEAIYQDMPMSPVNSKDGGDGGYEELRKKRGTEREGEYDTLNTTPAEAAGGEKAEAAGGEKTGGAYEALKKAGGKEEVYHTLGEVGVKGEEVGVKGEEVGVKGEEVGVKGGNGGDRAYEALKKSKDGGTEDLYHTLGEVGAKGGDGRDGGDGAYEALKKSKDGGTEDLFHTLTAEGGKE